MTIHNEKQIFCPPQSVLIGVMHKKGQCVSLGLPSMCSLEEYKKLSKCLHIPYFKVNKKIYSMLEKNHQPTTGLLICTLIFFRVFTLKKSWFFSLPSACGRAKLLRTEITVVVVVVHLDEFFEELLDLQSFNRCKLQDWSTFDLVIP